MVNSTKAPKVTYTNLFTLRMTFSESDRVSNRVPSGSYSHLKRCMAAGLLDTNGSELVLTATGREALHRNG